MCDDSLIEKTFEYVSGVLADEPSSHEICHIKRVEALCVKICNMESSSGKKDIDLEALRLAALLHDVGVVKEHREGGDHSIYGAQMATDFLLSQGLKADRVEKIASCIRSHRFSSGIKAIHIEGQILQDADRIDALGAIGIFRAILSMGALRCIKHEHGIEKASAKNVYSEDPLDGFIEYMDMKPFKIIDRLNTDSGKEIARERMNIMHRYLEELKIERSLI